MASAKRRLFIGVDCGTQSTKVVIVNGDSGAVVASGATAHEMTLGLPPGHVEQQPEHWFDAFESALTQAFRAPDVEPGDVCAIGVSGQQHGLVALDANGDVIRPAKLWCDTSTTKQCEEIIAAIGGLDRCIEAVGNGQPPGFTAAKIRWLLQNEPGAYERMSIVLLPHDYLNFRLTGRRCMECGDASGTGLLDVRRRRWSETMTKLVAAGLEDRLPELVAPDEPIGVVAPELAARWGLPSDVIVAPGGGDNMMAAIGTGNVAEGIATVSLGTSGTVFAYAAEPVVDPRGEIAGFCDSTGGWLPLVCTMNATVATELTKRLLSMDSAQLDAAVNSVAAGADGLLLIPYFQGERTPNVPDGSGVWFGATARTMTPAHFARAAMEGATLGLAFGLNRLRDLGVVVNEIRLTGGGANSAIWRKICADVFQAPVIRLESAESAAFGAAIQAKWVHERLDNRGAAILDVTRAWVRTMEQSRVEPEATNAGRYQELAAIHDEISASLRDAFSRHRRLIERG